MVVPQTLITVLTGLIGVLFGSSLTSYLNLRSARKDLLFKRKLEHFEKLTKDLEENMRLHKGAILSLRKEMKKKQVLSLLDYMKNHRKHFLMAASPLYFNIEGMTSAMTNFADVEKLIFAGITALSNLKTEASKQRLIFDLTERLQDLRKAQYGAIGQMRRELYQ